MSRKSNWTKWLVLIFSIALLASCGGGGGGGGGTGADTLSLAVDSGTSTPYTEQADSNGFLGYEPYIGGYADDPANPTIVVIDLCSGWAVATGCTTELKFTLYKTTATSYPATGTGAAGTSSVYYFAGNVIYDREDSGSITLSGFGGVGGRITGSYDVTVHSFSTGVVKRLTGQFDVTRTN